MATYAALPDRQLVEMSRAGDRAAFGQLVARYQRLLLSVAYHTGADADLAEDVAQDAFLRAWQGLDGFKMAQDNSFRAWICRIASNRTVDLLRRERPAADLTDVQLSGSVRPDEAFERLEVSLRVRQALLRLPENSRQALVLREYGQLSYREISQTLGVPIGTVMSRLNYARSWLRRELSRYVEAGG